MNPTPADPVFRYVHRLLQPAGSLDRELLARFVTRRDEAAFAELVQRHGPLVLGVCRRVLSHDHEAEDVFQATFLVLACRAGCVRKPESVGSWLHGVAFRLANRARRARARRRRHESQAPPRPARPEGDVSWRELRQVLDEELQRLPESYRLPLLLCILEGQTQDEAARQLGWAPGVLRGRLERGRERLRRRLTRRGLSLATALAAPLLAPDVPTVAAGLRQTTVRAALAFSFSPGAGESIPDPVAALARVGLRSFAAGPRALAALMVMAVALLAGSAGLAARSARVVPLAQEQPAQAASAAVVIPWTPAFLPAHADRHGDPLPPGALVRMGTTRGRQGGIVYALAFSSDGKFLASAGQEPCVRLWDAITRREIRQFAGHPPGGARGLTFSPDGRILATGCTASEDPTIRLWDVATGRLLRTLRGHQQGVGSLAFAPDGKTLVSASYDTTVRLWETRSGREVRRFPGPQQGLRAVAFSPDGRLVAAVGIEATIRLWEAATGKQMRQFPCTEGEMCTVAFAPDGKTLISAGHDHVIYLWEVATGRQLRKLAGHGQGIGQVAVSCDGQTLASASYDYTIRLWDLTTGQQRCQLRTWPEWVDRVAFAPDGKVLASGGGDRRIQLWDTVTGRELLQPDEHATPVRAVAFLPGDRGVLSGGRDGVVRLWGMSTGLERRRLEGHHGEVKALAVSGDGKVMASAGKDGFVRLWDAATGGLLRRLEGHTSAVTGVAFAPDGQTIVSSSDGSPGVCLWRLDGTRLRTLPESNGAYSVAFAAGGTLLAAGCHDGVMRLWDPATGTVRRRIKAHASWVVSLASSPDGRLLASAGINDGTVRLWDPGSGQARGAIAVGPGSVYSVAFSPDGKLLAAGGDKGMVGLWEAPSGKEVRWVRGHRNAVLSVAFSKDGALLASGSGDMTVLLWDVTGRFRENPPAAELDPVELEKLWRDLAGTDPWRTARAFRTLVAAPRQTIAFVGQRLHEVWAADPRAIALLIDALDDKTFAVRERAMAELGRLRRWAGPRLRQALAARPALEVRRRIERLLAEHRGPAAATPPPSRVVAVLEGIGSAEARTVLETLARKAPPSQAGREATAALERLRHKPRRPR